MYLELSALEMFEPRLSTPGSTWIPISALVTPAHRTTLASATQDIVFAHGIVRGSWHLETHPQSFPITRPHHNNPGINGHAPPHPQEGREDTGKMNTGEGFTGYPHFSPCHIRENGASRSATPRQHQTVEITK